MRKKPVVLSILGAAILLAGWYFWPRTLTGALPGLKQDGVTHCGAVLIPIDPGSGLASRCVNVDPASPEFEDLMELLSSTRYVRDPMDLFSWGRTPSTVVITLEPYPADVFLYQENGRSFTVQLFGPDLSLNDRTYLPLGGKAFQQKVADLLSSCPDVDGT